MDLLVVPIKRLYLNGPNWSKKLSYDNSDTLKETSEQFWSKLFCHVGNAETIVKVSRNGVIVFGLIATAGGISASIFSSGQYAKFGFYAGLIGILGAIGAVVAAFIQNFLEKDHTSLLENARKALDQSQAFLVKRDQILREIEDMRQLDEQRVYLQSSFATMLEHVEQIISSSERSCIRTALNGLFDISLSEFLAAMGMSYAERFSITVYRREVADETGDEILKIVKLVRPNQAEVGNGSREWEKGEGYSGHVWLTGEEVIIDDTMKEGVLSGFHVPEEKLLGKGSGNPREEHGRYRSVAACPILVGENNKFWGVVAVTTDRPGKFSKNDLDDFSVQNVESVRLLAKMISAIAAACDM